MKVKRINEGTENDMQKNQSVTQSVNKPIINQRMLQETSCSYLWSLYHHTCRCRLKHVLKLTSESADIS